MVTVRVVRVRVRVRMGVRLIVVRVRVRDAFHEPGLGPVPSVTAGCACG